MSKSAGHPRFDVSSYYVEVVWEPDLVHDNNSYDENANQMSDNDMDENEDENQKSEGWEHVLKNVALQILQIIVEVLIS